MDTKAKLFSQQVQYIYKLDPRIIHKLSRQKTYFTDSISEYYALQAANMQIKLFGVTRRQALLSTYVMSNGFRLTHRRYPHLFENLESSKEFNLELLQSAWIRENGIHKAEWVCDMINTLDESHFIYEELPVNSNAYIDALKDISIQYRRSWRDTSTPGQAFQGGPGCLSANHLSYGTGCHHVPLSYYTGMPIWTRMRAYSRVPSFL